MATVNKKSLREEFDKFKADVVEQVSSKSLSPEAVELFSRSITMQEMLMARFLEKNTPKTDKNSRKPSSQTDKDNSSKGKSGTHGKAPPRKEWCNKEF
jgi:hypothetical protein